MEEVLLSIVIPTYNRINELQHCLSNICKETADQKGFEILVIDDGSEQSVAAQNKKLCTAQKVTYVKIDHSGMAIARNKGVERAHGEWVAFLDDDVLAANGWFIRAIEILKNVADDVYGIEGKVVPTGSKLWDNEVQNLEGGAYLTCHMFYRKKILEQVGSFDIMFGSLGPFCEDHELAVRVLKLGKIIFEPSLIVNHLPRKINLIKYLRDSSKRMTGMLRSELYFYKLHPDRYYMLRNARTFYGTYATILFKNLIYNLRRRTVSSLLAHPLQFAFLVLSSIIEQCKAWFLIPELVFGKNPLPSKFAHAIDGPRTAKLWHMKDFVHHDWIIHRSWWKSLLFPLIRKPVYSMDSFLINICKKADLSGLRILLRVDDVYLEKSEQIEHLCMRLERLHVPFMAAVTTRDLLRNNDKIIKRLLRARAHIGVHGFEHKGKFGPYESELLQMSVPELHKKILDIRNAGVNSEIFIPPFNAINQEQILLLADHFSIICGGPESMRFVGQYSGPLALKEKSWWVPSLFPFYSDSHTLLSSDIEQQLSRSKGFACITVHLAKEAETRFEGLIQFLDRWKELVSPWTMLLTQNK